MTNAFDQDRDNQIARLLKLAGRRPAPGPDCLLRARDAARAEWRQVLQVRARQRLLKAIVAAAIIGVAGGAAWMWAHRAAPVDRSEIATLQRVIGTVRVSEGAVQGPATMARTNGRIRAGDRLETDERGGAAVQCFGGPSIRLHAGTAVRFESSSRLHLDRGTIYVDSGPQQARNWLVVVTGFGNVRHLGTQFEVVLQAGSLDVRVREGEVSIESGNGRLTAAAGEALLVRARSAGRTAPHRDLWSRLGMGPDHGPAVHAGRLDRAGVPRVGEPRGGAALGVRRCRRQAGGRSRRAARID